MSLPTSPLPTVGQPNNTEDPKIRAALSELQAILTAGVDNSNLGSTFAAGALGYRTLLTVPFYAVAPTTGTYTLGSSQQYVPSAGANAMWPCSIKASDLAVAGRTTFLRLVADYFTNNTSPGAGVIGFGFSTFTLSGVNPGVTLNTSQLASPTLSGLSAVTAATVYGADTAIPADGLYAVTATVSVAPATNSVVYGLVRVQARTA